MSTQNLLFAGDGLTGEDLNEEPIQTAASGNQPDGSGDTPPAKPDGSGEGSGSEDSTVLTGVLQLDDGTESYDGGTLSSTNSDENVILAQNGASLTISNYTLNKTGDCSNADNSNFYAVNAVVAAKSAAKIYIDNSVLNSSAEGANGLFASGEGSTIYAYNCTITSTGNSSRGLDATYEGTVIASKMTISTSGDHCAALATDRGDGYISVTDSTLTTAGQGSPLIYSTGIIEVNNVTGTSTGSQIAGIEGLSTIRIKNSSLSGSAKKASEPVANGVIIYQSMSGDSTEGTATFEVADSTLASAISGGAMFYVTNTSAVITVQNTVLDFDSSGNALLKAAGNDGSNGWGTAGSNGAEVIFTAIDQTLAGTVSVDGISSLDMYLINADYTGTFVLDATYAGNGGTNLYVDANSTWTVTGSCTLQSLTAASGASIVDANGETVSIVTAAGETIVAGTSDFIITVSAYSTGTVEALYTVKDFEIDRSAMPFDSADVLSAATGNFTGTGGVFQLMSDGTAYIRTTDAKTQLTGTVDASQWEIVGVGDFNGSGHDGVLWQEKATGYVYMQYDVSGLSEITGKTNCLGVVEEGYTIKSVGDFTGNGIAGALLQTPAFGDPEISTNYGLAVWARNDDGGTFNGWLGALVNTWEDGAELQGDLSDPESINANNYRYEVVGVADFNGDGVDDVMFRNTMPETVTQDGVDCAITGSGDLFTFLTGDKQAILEGADPTVCYAGREVDGWKVVDFGDFNADGTDDVILSNGSDLAGWSMADGQRQDNLWFGTLADGDAFFGIADVNHDGTDDVIIRTASTEQLTAWTVENGTVTGTLAIV